MVRPLRVAFFGTPDFALATLRRLHGSTHDVVLVVTQPDRPRGRGHKLTPSPVKAFAVEQVSDAKYRLDASMIANQRIGRMWVDQANLANYVTTNQSLPELPDGKLTITVVGTSDVTVTVNWTPPHSGIEHTFSQVARINPSS